MTTRETLTSVPDSNLAKRIAGGSCYMFIETEGAYFLDEDPDAFAVILNYLRYQILEVPANLARGVVLALAKDFALDITSKAKVAQLKGKEAQIDVIIPTAIHSQNNNNLPIKHLDNEELQRRQNKFQVEQSKNKKKAMLPKHTNEEDNKQELALLFIKEIQSSLLCTHLARQSKATEFARKILTRASTTDRDVLINLEILPRFVECMTERKNPALQLEAATVLTNITAGSSQQTTAVVKSGAVPHFIRLLQSGEEKLVEQSILALGNISCDGPGLRDIVINNGVVPPLLALIKPDTTVRFLLNVTWIISKLCQNKNSSPSFEMVKQFIPTLAQLIEHSNKEVQAKACWALSYLTDDGSNEQIQEVVNAGVVGRLIELLNSKQQDLIIPSLGTLGNIVTGNDKHKDAVLQGNILACLVWLLRHANISIAKSAAWVMSNIMAGNSQQIQMVIEAGCLQPLINILLCRDEPKVQKEAAQAVKNLTSHGTLKQINFLRHSRFLKPYTDLLESEDDDTVILVLEGLRKILDAAETDTFAEIVEDCGGLDKIRAIQCHENDIIMEMSMNMVEVYFVHVLVDLFPPWAYK